MTGKKDETQSVPKVPAEAKADKSDDGKISWKRPSGTKITTNAEPATVAHCEAQGWKRV